MKKILTLTLTIIILSNLSASAQRRKTVFFEYLGSGLTYSGNFELRLKKGANSGGGIRVGIGGASMSGTDNNGNFANIGIITVPLGYNYLIGEKKSSFEIGAGVTPIFTNANGSFNGNTFDVNGPTIAGFLNAGYRYQPLKNGFTGKLTWTPAVTNMGFQPLFFGLGLGFSFR